ncbi:enoyl-CoA hydratase/isomerase family protein [Polynucleobacter kasalickyi]|uniref:Enoyl-CoA hydratase /trans-2, cis-3 decenoyl-[acyl-carrier-protein] isomerase n=1 Tax=Polynucleobacter kasalickyi TaxID=1938817 RepID=A0A1W2B370_9BURK|nr:enoyl-CoA hydratase/isomerase family protein [Polynucleobacter kasalickyi]SMC67171.1 Enoyl-CoA hydratase /trans-2, cis-3 decenoyl-[acyl-carrier-protein] isomerase [Polynucleobacter kasalickyi]
MNPLQNTQIAEGITSFPEGVVLDRNQGVILLTIDREDDFNRINWDVLKRMEFITELLKEDRSANVLVITGRGKSVFSLGLLNPKLRAEMTKDSVVQLIRYANQVFNNIETLPQIVICAINGKVIAGGFELSLACDLRYAANHVTMQLPEAGWGGFPGAGAPFRLPTIVGAARALEIICLGNELDATALKDLGIVQNVFASDQFLEKVMEIASQINEKGPLAIKGTKSIIRARMQSGLAEAAELSKVLRHSLEWSADVDEGMKAHTENRKPKFEGR